MLKRVVACLFGMALCYSFITPRVWADAIDDAVAQKQDLERQIKQVEVRRREARERFRKANKDFNSVVQSLSNLQQRAVYLNSREGQLKDSMQDNESKLFLKEREFENRRFIYEKRLRDIYINGQVSYLEVLLGAEDFGDFVGRMYLLEKVVAGDVKLLKEISDSISEIKSRKDRSRQELGEITATRAQIEEDRERMRDLRDKRQQMLAVAEEEKVREEQEYDRLLEISERVTEMVRAMEQTNPQRFPDRANDFIWPCNGPITSYAGWRIHPVFGTKKYHSGMDIGVDYYTPIKASNRGTVTYSGWMDGYGYVVMIDHGEGYVTLYAHNSSLTVNEGQFVHKGDVIAKAGATGYATGPHCHFEVREHGAIVDPLKYISEADNIY